MKKSYQITLVIAAFFFITSFTTTLHAQAFKKGAFLLSLSGGSTTATYATNNPNRPLINGENSSLSSLHSNEIDGIRDPLFIEFGLTNRWGIGLSSGNDLFTINPLPYYGFKLSEDKPIVAKTSELTFDLNYHFYTRQKVDLSVYTSLGSFGVAFSGKDGDDSYNYNSKGCIVRAGVKARYYFWKRLGALVMVSAYSGNSSPDGIKGVTVGQNTSTSIRGTAIEYGLCFRFF